MGFFKNLKEDFSQAMNELLPEDDLLDSDFMDDVDNIEYHNEAERKEQPEALQADKAKVRKEADRDLQEVLEEEVKEALLSESAAAREDSYEEDVLTAIQPGKKEESDSDELADFLDMDIFNELLGEEDAFDEEESEKQEEDLTDEDVLNVLLSGEDVTKESRTDTKDDEIISEEDLDLLFSSNDFESDDLESMVEEPQEYEAAFRMDETDESWNLNMEAPGISDEDLMESPQEDSRLESAEQEKEADEVYLQEQDQLSEDLISEDLGLNLTKVQEKPAEDLSSGLDKMQKAPSEDLSSGLDKMQKAPSEGLSSGLDKMQKAPSEGLSSDLTKMQDKLSEDVSLDLTEPQNESSEDLDLKLIESEDIPTEELSLKSPESKAMVPEEAAGIAAGAVLKAAEGVLKETGRENNMEEEEMDEIFNNGAGSEGDDADLDLIAQLLEEDNGEDVEGVDEEIVARSESEEEPKAEEAASEPRQANDDVTVITKGTVINGSITSDGSLEIMGSINGDIDCLGKLTVVGNIAGNSRAAEVYVNAARVEGGIVSTGSVKLGAGTVVIGDVKATSAVVAGAIKGELDIEGPVIIDSTAIVKGNINAKSVQINNGAVVDGYCSLTYAAVDIDNFFDGDK